MSQRTPHALRHARTCSGFGQGEGYRVTPTCSGDIHPVGCTAAARRKGQTTRWSCSTPPSVLIATLPRTRRRHRPTIAPASAAISRASVSPSSRAATRPSVSRNTVEGMVRAPMPRKRPASSFTGSNRDL